MEPFTIQNQAVVQTIAGFASLDSVGGNLYIQENKASLTEISSFAVNLTDIGGYLDIADNAGLATVSGFGALTSIENCINIVTNPKLTALPTFPDLTSIKADLFIVENKLLTSVSGYWRARECGKGCPY